MKLIGKLLAGIIIGVIIGSLNVDIVNTIIVTFKNLFSQLIDYVIPLIIFFFIASGIISIGKGSGKLVTWTVIVAYTSTILAGLLALLVVYNLLPIIGSSGSVPKEPDAIKPLFNLEFDPLMGVLTALITAFIFGILSVGTNAQTMNSLIHEGQKIVTSLIEKIIIPILPFYIASIFTEMAAQGTVFKVAQVFGIVLLIAIVLHWVWLIILYVIAGSLAKRNPFVMLKTMLPAYFTALGTMSSAATIPVTLKQSKKNHITPSLADFSIPLLATIHLSGSIITVISCSVAAMLVLPGLTLASIPTMIGFIFMLGIIMIAAPGVPGGAIMAASGIITSFLGFDESAIGLIIAIYMAQDSLGTATNVTGDGAISVIIDHFSGHYIN